MELYYRGLEVVLNCLVRDADYWNDAEYEDKEFKVDYEYEVDDSEVIDFLADYITTLREYVFEEYEKLYDEIILNKDYYFKKYEGEIKKHFEDEAREEAEKKGEDYFF